MRALALIEKRIPAALLVACLSLSPGVTRAGGPDSTWIVARPPAMRATDPARSNADDAGRYYAAPPESAGVRIMRFDREGRTAAPWPPAGLALSSSRAGRMAVALVADRAGELTAFWTEARDSASASELVAERLMPDGTRDPAWPASAMPVCAFPVDIAPSGPGRYDPAALAALSDSSGGAFVAWVDRRSDEGNIYVQHVLSDGAIPPGWSPGGSRACGAAGGQRDPVLLGDGDEGVFVAWRDTRNGRLFVQHLGSDGQPLPGWPADGSPVSRDASGSQALLQLASDGDGGAIAIWRDERGASAAAHFAGEPDLPPGLSLRSADIAAGAARLVWEGSAARGHEVVIERSGENEPWHEVGRTLGDLQGCATFVDHDVRPGRQYAWRATRETADGFVISGNTVIDVPRQPRFDLEPIAADSSVDRIELSFALPDPAPAKLELLDGAGRVVQSLDLTSLGPGTHVLELVAARTLPPGLYSARLEQSGHLAVRRTHLLHAALRGRRSRRG